MPEFTAIIRGLTPEKFAEILSSSGRKAREIYFHRHGVRPKKSKGLPKAGAKNEARIAGLFDALRTKEDDELAEEVLRSWLLTKRPMLAATLDYLKVPHENGLTDSEDISRFEELKAKDIKAIAKNLAGIAPKEDVIVYLKFMGANNVDEVLK